MPYLKRKWNIHAKGNKAFNVRAYRVHRLKSIKRKDVGWFISYAYLGYIFIGQLPALRESLFFSSTVTPIVLIPVYIASSILIIGSKRSIKFFLVAAIIGTAMEFLSLNTGFPFGRYYYTDQIGPFIGQIPVFVPLLWASLSFYSYAAGGKYGMPFLIVFTDLALDPRFSGHLWIWISTTQYFGDPITNFVGWFLTSAIIIIFYSIVEKKDLQISMFAIGFYLLFGISSCISDANASLVLPAIISVMIFIASSIFLVRYAKVRK